VRSLSRLLLLALVVLLPWAAAHGQASVTTEEVKAAFLVRFAGFVDWPAQARADEQLVIGVVDSADVEAELRRYAELRPAGNRPTAVRTVQTPADLAGVHIFFIGSRDPARLSRWIAAARSLPVLLVTDAPVGLERGSMINFITTDRVQFEAAADAAARAGLRLNPRLLSVAARVKKGELGGETLLAGSPPRVAQARRAARRRG
jgi:hypothetical protein